VSTTTEARTVDPIGERVAALRATAASDPVAAQADAWAWIEELGESRDTDSLDALLRLGTTPDGLDGPTDGILVTLVANPLVNAAIEQLTDAWMPWTGKTFDAAAQTGVNQMTSSSRVLGKVLWPLYSMREADDGKLAFDFKTGTVQSELDPSLQVMKIEYEHVEENPRLVIRQILDELVEVVPDTYLGWILVKLPAKGWVNIGYFALKQDAGVGG
jgi:hypothetical protein